MHLLCLIWSVVLPPLHTPPPPSHTVSGVAPNSLPPYMQSLMDPNKGASRMSDEAWEEEGNEDEGGTGRLLEEDG